MEMRGRLFRHQIRSLAIANCTASSDCWAVGANTSIETIEYHTLIEHWNGTAWMIVPAPNTLPGHYDFAGDVSCTAASQCWAVGTIDSNTGLIQQWNGTQWST